MAEAAVSSSSSSSEDDEPITNKQLANKLHNSLATKLNSELTPKEFKLFKHETQVELPRGVLAVCEDVIDVFEQLETKDIIRPGEYKPLCGILKRAGLKRLYTMVKDEGKRIHDVPTVAKRGKSEDLTQPGNVKESEAEIKLREESKKFQEHCKSKIKDLHVETQPCKTARSQLENQPTILLAGNSGDGKSSALDSLAANSLPGYHPIPCSGPEDIERYINLVTILQLLFICDEPFGGSFTRQQLVDNWMNKGKKLEMHLKNHKFVFATRKSVWNECKIHLHKSPFFCNLIDVNSETLTKEDKQKMLQKYQGESEILTEREKNEIVDYDKPIAYAQCCKLMSDAIKHGHTGERLVEIFKRPFTFLSEDLEKMAKENKAQYATLCLIMLCGGQIECEELSHVTDDEVRKRMDVVVRVYGCKQLDLQECAQRLSGTYLVKTHKNEIDLNSCDIYKFSHDSIAEAVTMKFGQEHFRHCLDHLKRDVVVNIVRPKNYQKGEQEFAINVPDPTKYYGEIAGMFTQTVIDANGSRGLGGVCENPCVTDEKFQSVWIDYLTKTSPDKLVPFCQSKDGYGLYYRYGRCVLYYLAKSGADKLVRYLCEHPARQTLTLTCRCERSEVWLSSCPIEGAVRGDQTETVAYLLTDYTVSQVQIDQAVDEACVCGSVRVLERLLTDYTMSQVQIGQAVDVACECDSVRVLERLLTDYTMSQVQIGQAVDVACMYDSVRVLERLLTDYTMSQVQIGRAVDVACESDSVRVLERLLTDYTMSQVQIGQAVDVACMYDSVRVLERLLTYYTMSQVQIGEAVYEACEYDRVRVLERLLTYYTMSQEEIDEAVDVACECDSVRVLERLLTDYTMSPVQIDEAVCVACECDSVRVLERLLTDYTMSPVQIDEAVCVACRCDSVRVLKVLLPLLHEDREQTIKRRLRTACEDGRVRTVEYLLSEVYSPCGGLLCVCVGLPEPRRDRAAIVRVILSSGHKVREDWDNESDSESD